jgi:peptidoglycan/LPS O-acetylase OafA/YrhL
MALANQTGPHRGVRLPALDGLRGLLALVVLGKHFSERFGVQWLHQPSQAAVCCFFVLSGYVLTRSWDGRFALFLARRIVRLWPVYGLALAAGYWIADEAPVWTQFLWYPLLSPNAAPQINVPIWSLRIEAWAMLFMPFFVWTATGKPWRVLAGFLAVIVASAIWLKFFFGLYFVVGAVLSRRDFRNRFLESAGPQWLGRISYSLYLTHWLVFKVAQSRYGDAGLVASVPVAFFVGWLVWRFVEMPSIALSRRIGSVSKAQTAGAVALAPAE